MTQAELANKPIAMTEQGNGAAVVLLHGLFGSADNLGLLARALASDFRVISVDLPGHGRSAHVNDYSFPSLASAISEALTASGVDTFSLVGHSLGGKVSMQLASDSESDEHPQNIHKMVIVDIAPRQYPPHHNDVFAGLRAVTDSGVSSRRDAEEILAQHIDDASVRSFLLKSFRRNDDDSWRWFFDAQQLAAQYNKLSAVPGFNHVINCPTLFIKGAESNYLQPGDEAPIRQAFKHPTFKIIHGTGHWPHAEKPAAFNKLVRTFLAEKDTT